MNAPFDVDRLRKVAALMEAGATAGERSAARSRAEAIAAAAGLTLDAAMSKLDTAPMADHPGFRVMTEEEFRQKWADAAERKWRSASAAYGPPGDLFEDTARERLLRVALMPLARWKKFGNCDDLFVDGFADWSVGPPRGAVLEAIGRAYPLPTTIPEAWDEFAEWEDLADRRARYSDADVPPWARARIAALEWLLDDLPVRGWEDMDVRLRWRDHLFRRGMLRSWEDEEHALRRLREDLEILKAASVQSGRTTHRTSAQKRAAVREILETEGDLLSDREIARRVGVSPQTVNNWRHKGRD